MIDPTMYARIRRATPPALAACTATVWLASGCIFAPEAIGIVEVDHPPYIDPASVVPNPTDEPSVSFNLAVTDRRRQFQIKGVYDWDADDVLTHAFVIRIGTGAPISIPAASDLRPRLRESETQNMDFARRYETNALSFDPCNYRDVVDGIAQHGTIQVIIYDQINTTPSAPLNERGDYIVRWTWPLEFSGRCPVCAVDVDCFEDEECKGGVCVPMP